MILVLSCHQGGILKSSDGEKRAEKSDSEILGNFGNTHGFCSGVDLDRDFGMGLGRDLGRLALKGGYKGNRVLFPEQAVVEEVLDGDTFELKNGRIVRMVGVDAPNRGKRVGKKQPSI